MEKAAKIRLKYFMEENFAINILRKEGFFDKTKMKRYDYEAMAERVCIFFGLKSVYEYAHILDKCSGVVCIGKEGDKSGMASCGAYVIKPKVDMTNPVNWNVLKAPEKIDLISQDKYLN